MIKNFDKLKNEALTAFGKIKSNRLLKISKILMFVLFFGASLSVKAQNYLVDRSDDNTVSTCDSFTANDCTLRGAIQRANTDGSPSVIQLAIPQNFGQSIVLIFSTLSIANDQSLLITSDPVITGDFGVNRRAVDGGTSLRVFSVNPGANVTFRNIAVNAGGFTAPNDGAAIDNNGGTAAIDNCFFGANVATDDGGAIKNTVGATMTINNTDFFNNFAATTARGGAIFNEGTLTITNSLFRGNKARNGGAIANAGTLTIRNTTISGNDATDSGGGIYTQSGTVSIGNSTITRNRADFPSDGIGAGGGVGKSSPGLTVNVGSSIIAANTNGTVLTSGDFDGEMTSQLGYNILGNSSGTTITGQTFGNQLDVDPKLLPLSNNGGSLMTHALAPNSPAIDKGSQICIPNLVTDNRGLPRRFDFPGITDANTGVDVGAFERQPRDRNGFDFDGDRKTDVAVFRPSNGNWYLNQSTAGFTGVTFGLSTDRVTPADYDGDGKTDVAVFRNGIWYLQRSSLGFTGIAFEQAGDIPLPGDFDGDGKAEICVFRPTNGTWYYLRSTTGAFVAVAFGQMGDVPVNMDFDGDLKNDIALFRPSVGTWYFLLSSNNNQFTGIAFGIAEDKPVPGDFDGDGRTDMAVWRPSAGAWYRLLSSNASFVGTAFGASTDLPVQGDFDGDDKADLSVFRPTNGTWYLQQSAAGFTGIAFGANGDKPAPGAFVP